MPRAGLPRRAIPLAPLMALLLAAACGRPVADAPGAPAPPTSAPGGAREITVFAATSLTDAFREIGAAFEATHPGTRVTFSFGASSQLRAQLQQGARADVFASADQAQMDSAREAGAVLGDARVFARNRLVLVTPADSPARIVSLKDLANDGVKLVTARPAVPVGQYTVQVLENASADPAYGADFTQRVLRNVVSHEDNVRQVLSKVQLGEGDAGVVYSSDVTSAMRDRLHQVPIPDELNVLASYPIAVTRGTNPTGGEAFMQFVLSPPAQEILVRWGFLPA